MCVGRQDKGCVIRRHISLMLEYDSVALKNEVFMMCSEVRYLTVGSNSHNVAIVK